MQLEAIGGIHKTGRRCGLHFSEVTLAVGDDKSNGQVVGVEKAGTRTGFNVLKGLPAFVLYRFHCLQEPQHKVMVKRSPPILNPLE